MSERKSYGVTAERDDRFWLLRVRDLGLVTQARRLDQAEHMARDLIATALEVPADSFDVWILPTFEGEIGKRVHDALSARMTAARSQVDAARKTRAVARELAEQRLTTRDIAQVLGVSHQRVAQVLSEPEPQGPEQVNGPLGETVTVFALRP